MLKIKQLFFLLMFVGCGLDASNKHFPRRSVSPKSNTAAKSTSFDFGFAKWKAKQISLDAQKALPESAYKINKTGDKVLDLSKPAFLRDRAGKYKTWLIGGTISTAAIIAGIILGLSLHRENRAAQAAEAKAAAEAEAKAKAAAEAEAKAAAEAKAKAAAEANAAANAARVNAERQKRAEIDATREKALRKAIATRTQDANNGANKPAGKKRK